MYSLMRRLLFCRFGLHKHSRRHARHTAKELTSRCRHCGVKMRRDRLAGWIEDRRELEPPA
ncbi:MAG: hypothetical protein O9254_00115 [Rhodobacteraceae bacterium]|nr:hypothetical protein [Paracoccaceae bacterium]